MPPQCLTRRLSYSPLSHLKKRPSHHAEGIGGVDGIPSQTGSDGRLPYRGEQTNRFFRLSRVSKKTGKLIIEVNLATRLFLSRLPLADPKSRRADELLQLLYISLDKRPMRVAAKFLLSLSIILVSVLILTICR